MGEPRREPPRFERQFFDGPDSFTLIGSGQLGGKAAALLDAHDALAARPPGLHFPDLEIVVPTLAVVGTDIFDGFLHANALAGRDWSSHSDRAIAQEFQRAALPPEISGDLWDLVRRVRQPLAVRSSSLLEDALAHPFAGVYATKMIPNGAPDPETRFRKLTEAIRFVYASTFFRDARDYRRAIAGGMAEEKMAVVLQEVVGRRHGQRFYPDVAGVARSFHFYALPPALAEEGVVSLALGLGKTIVDGGQTWTYSPAHPLAPPPFRSIGERLNLSQREFWAVNMGPAPYDPTSEDEHLVPGTLDDARLDGTLDALVSSYDAGRDRLVPGAVGEGARVLDFAPLLQYQEPPLNAAVRGLLALFGARSGGAVELELAVTLAERATPARLGFLQVRPMAAPGTSITLDPAELQAAGNLVASPQALGDGVVAGLHHVVYVKPEAFDRTRTLEIAQEVAERNAALAEAGLGYLLIGFGRWGSADRFLGIPVTWPQVSGARVIVEASLPGFGADMSQGSHFFHNLLALRVPYLCVPEASGHVDFAALAALPARHEGPFLRHVELPAEAVARVDGRHGRAVLRLRTG